MRRNITGLSEMEKEQLNYFGLLYVFYRTELNLELLLRSRIKTK